MSDDKKDELAGTEAPFVSHLVELRDRLVRALIAVVAATAASAVFGLVMVTIAARPADDEHPYGHHKAEYFSSGFEGILIIVAVAADQWIRRARA